MKVVVVEILLANEEFLGVYDAGHLNSGEKYVEKKYTLVMLGGAKIFFVWCIVVFQKFFFLSGVIFCGYYQKVNMN